MFLSGAPYYGFHVLTWTYSFVWAILFHAAVHVSGWVNASGTCSGRRSRSDSRGVTTWRRVFAWLVPPGTINSRTAASQEYSSCPTRLLHVADISSTLLDVRVGFLCSFFRRGLLGVFLSARGGIVDFSMHHRPELWRVRGVSCLRPLHAQMTLYFQETVGIWIHVERTVAFETQVIRNILK